MWNSKFCEGEDILEGYKEWKEGTLQEYWMIEGR